MCIIAGGKDPQEDLRQAMVHVEGQRRSKDVFQVAKGRSIVGIINMLF